MKYISKCDNKTTSKGPREGYPQQYNNRLVKGISRSVALLSVGITFLASCFSTPISYDTAEIPDNSRNLKVGLGGQHYYEIYEDFNPFSGSTFYYSRDFNVRGDVQAGYGWRRIVEVGVMGGVAVGYYKYTMAPSHTNRWGWEGLVDVYPYVKVGIPTDPVRFSIKPSFGQGFLFRQYHSRFFLVLSPRLDLLVGFGKPERLTLGASLLPGSNEYTSDVLIITSLHHSDYTFSFMSGWNIGHIGNTGDWYVTPSGTLHFGIGKRVEGF